MNNIKNVECEKIMYETYTVNNAVLIHNRNIILVFISVCIVIRSKGDDVDPVGGATNKVYAYVRKVRSMMKHAFPLNIKQDVKT